MRGLRPAGFLAAVLAAGCTVVGAPAGAPSTGRGVAPPDTAREARPPSVARRVGAEAGPTRRFEEVRGVWVVRTTLSTPEGVRAMVARAEAGGFNTLLVQVRGRGDAYYESRWEPRAEALTDRSDFDPLALTIQEAHARGMAVHAWVNTYLVWSGPTPPRSPLHLVNARPDWLAVPRALARDLWNVDPFAPRFTEALVRYAAQNPETVEGMYSSPSSPAVQERVYDVWMDLADHYELDGIHFDYVRFPSAEYDYSRSALDRFRSWIRGRLTPARFGALDEAYDRDPFAFTDALPGPWGEFRRAQVTELVERVYHGVKARRPDLLVSAAVFSDVADAYNSRFQDWRRWLQEDVVDVVVPMAYTPRNEIFRAQIREAAVSAGRQDRIWAGIGAYLNGYDGTLDKIDIARREGAGGVILFSYDWASTEGSPSGSVPFLERVGRAKFGGN